MDILIIGQSNAVRMTGAGEDAMTSLLEASLGEPVTIVNAAVGGSALTPFKANNWTDGGLYEAAIAEVAGAPIDAVLWIQGESDAENGVDGDVYEAALGDLFARLRGELGDIPIYLQPLMLRAELCASIQHAQLQYAQTDPLTSIVEPNQELGTFDQRHFNESGYAVIGDAIARAMLADLGVTPAWLPQIGTGGDDTLWGAVGSDTIYAAGGDDLLCVRAGDDLALGEAGNDAVKGGGGADLLAGGSGDDLVAGGAGADSLYGDAGVDTLRGGEGDDVLAGNYDRDVMIGGDGADVFYVTDGDRVRDFTPGEDQIAIRAVLYGDPVYLDGRLYSEGVELLAVLTGAPALSEGDLLFF